MKKKIQAAAVILLLCAAVTGCGSQKENQLEIFSTKMENKDILQKLADDYVAEHPDVEIVLTSPPDAGTVLRTKLTKNRVPDVMFIGGDIAYTDMQGAEVLTDLSEEPYAQGIKTAYKEQVYRLNEDKSEKMYGVPYATNASGVIYNKDIFEQNGIEIPKTYDEFIQVCETLKSKGIQPINFTLKDSWTAICIWNALCGSLITPEFGLERLENKTTFAGTHERVCEEMLELLKYGQEDLLGTGYDDGNIAFANGKAAMCIQGNWAISNIKKSNPDIPLDMFPFPATNNIEENKVTSGIDVMACISKTTKHDELARDFVAYVMEKDKALEYINNQFAFSAIEGVDQLDASVAGLSEAFDKEAIGEFVDHTYPSGFDAGALVQGFLGKQGDISEFLQNFDKEYDKYNDN